MNSSAGSTTASRVKTNQNIQVYVRVRPLNSREKLIRSQEVIEVSSPKEIVVRQMPDSKMTKKFTFDRTFGTNSRQVEVYQSVVAPLIEEVLAGYNCTVFAYGQTGTGKTHTMIGTECPELKSSWEDESMLGIIPRAVSHLFDELRLMEVEFSMRISYLELYNEELCDLLSSDDSTKIRIFDDVNKKGSVIIQGLEEIPVHSKDDVYKLLEKGKERRKTATTLMNAQSSRSHTVFSILVHIKENGMDGEEMLKIGKLNLVDLAGSENISKAGNEKGIRTRETVNINQSLLTLGRVITALVERTPHIPYRESKLTRLLQESLGGRTKTSIIATISPGHKDLEETLSTLEYAHRAKNIQNKPELNQKLTKKIVLKEYLEEIDRLKRDLVACRDKNGIYLAEDTYNELQYKLDSQNRELNEKILLLKALRDDLASKERLFNEVSLNLVEKSEELKEKDKYLEKTKTELDQTKKILTATKRRYKEQKYLLENHVQTEQELTKQATDLVEVADEATTDTIKLQKTIDRRRTVDNEIKSVCEQFVNKMQNSFHLMRNNLDFFRNKHETYSDIIKEEISNTVLGHKAFSAAATEKLTIISNIHMESINFVNNFFEKMAIKISDVNKDNVDEFHLIIDEIKEKKNDFEDKWQIQMKEIMEFIRMSDEISENNCKKIMECVNEYNNTTRNFSIENIAQIQNDMNICQNEWKIEIDRILDTTNYQENISINRKKAINDLEKYFAEFINKMQVFENENNTEISKLRNISENLQCTNNKAVQNFNTTLCNFKEFNDQTEQKFNDVKIKVSTSKADIKSILDKKVETISNIKKILTDDKKDQIDSVENLQSINEKYINKVTELVDTFKTDVKSSEQTLFEKMDNECKIGKDTIMKEYERVVGHNTQSMAFNQSLQSDFNEYKATHQQSIEECDRNLEKFYRNELKTYSPTGQTPAKREFSYPRILAATSPHNRLLRRFRLQNEWSDLDTTTTITEDSELTLHDISNDRIVVNSTPIKNTREESDKLKVIPPDFNFKIPQLLISFDDQSNSNSSYKSSPHVSDKEEDKENIY